ncbi:hypothetical protein LSH36_72g04020 [Paralvinella palmiformis]|uniref:Cholesterol side-chain cleavage enzyme, mitochondrial n=1 Tax=Paralvinella palmiformis TaxID=53620 RepID=A0AAD9NCV9_9ANNE|nr:hypothetical protein LSH36_72g04020 [Paralvinella palmiformis]
MACCVKAVKTCVQPMRSKLLQMVPQMCYVTAATTDEFRDAKPFTSIPGPVCFPLIGSLYTVPQLIKEKNANDAKAVETLHRYDGKYPRRIIIQSWQDWRDESPYARGIFIEDGSAWKRMRVLLDKQILRPQIVSGFAEQFGQVTVDFIQRLRKLRDENKNTVNNLDLELFYWSLESIGTVLYETRFGGLSEDRDPEIESFIEAVHNLFLSTNYVFYLPRKLNHLFLSKWQKMHDNAWFVIFREGRKRIDKKCMEIEKELSEGREVSGLLSKLIASGNMSQNELYSNISELMAAAVDTTSNTMQWVIYELSRRSDIQSTLRDEVLSVVSRGTAPNAEQVQKMPYLKAFIKEVLRLYPVASVETRVTNEDMVLCGYHVPKDIRVIAATYLLGRNPEYYPDPLEVKPERWIRNTGNKKVHSFAWLPFGYGTRMCIGQYKGFNMLLQEFTIKAVDDKVNSPVTRALLIPERPVFVQFVDRC